MRSYRKQKDAPLPDLPAEPARQIAKDGYMRALIHYQTWFFHVFIKK
jgi:hypothetical protein